MSYKQSNNPISRKTSPINKENPYDKNYGLGNTISEDKLDLKSGSTSVHKPSEYNPYLSGHGQQGDVDYEHISDMEEVGEDQPDYESDDYKSPVKFMGINPDHKGYCTPMTKSTCTPHRKALAKRLKPGGDLYKGKKK